MTNLPKIWSNLVEKVPNLPNIWQNAKNGFSGFGMSRPLSDPKKGPKRAIFLVLWGVIPKFWVKSAKSYRFTINFYTRVNTKIPIRFSIKFE